MKNQIPFCSLSFCLVLLAGGCKPREFNQSRTKDLTVASDDMVTVCQMVAPGFENASTEAKAALRVTCTGQCNGVEYRGKKFFVLNEERVAGIEFSATTKEGAEIRNLFLLSPADDLLTALKNISLESPDVQRSLPPYGLDTASITSLNLPADAKILLKPGTRASLSSAGLLDGGTLDCGGQPIEGSVELEQFKTQNINDVRNSLTPAK